MSTMQLHEISTPVVKSDFSKSMQQSAELFHAADLAVQKCLGEIDKSCFQATKMLENNRSRIEALQKRLLERCPKRSEPTELAAVPESKVAEKGQCAVSEAAQSCLCKTRHYECEQRKAAIGGRQEIVLKGVSYQTCWASGTPASQLPQHKIQVTVIDRMGGTQAGSNVLVQQRWQHRLGSDASTTDSQGGQEDGTIGLLEQSPEGTEKPDSESVCGSEVTDSGFDSLVEMMAEEVSFLENRVESLETPWYIQCIREGRMTIHGGSDEVLECEC
eukprot:gnl/TRDRNA2_/TRDRNA2_30805_c0_seq1.p1 gnl/TRDRNA2_/TRDRNA2_30805_c0~~gnl/TRDRNA2_/TRDRNA2_30805_c0_seq1.p1  ORF type:complete len:274 (+),score=49.54 gnl/TRDRNA2_/TRDRNA2_30805_c0_seq1:61-882(+)